jgi:two-component system, NarL family, response regulator DevR
MIDQFPEKTPALLRILIVDDHPVVRAGLREMAKIDPQIMIVGEAGSASQAIIATKELLPDVVLLDIRLPDGSGLKVCRVLKALPSPPRVLFLTSFADNALLLEAMEAGGDGYILKENDHEQIISAVRTIFNGGALFDPLAVRSALQSRRGNSSKARLLESLSPQERKVLEEVSSGKTDKEIAAAIDLTPKTVRNYLDRLFGKLEVSTRTEAARVWFDSQKPEPGIKP